jgi:hypothetical protein
MAVLVGRAAELQVLEAALGDARAGRGRLFLLVGEPGIGKTRQILAYLIRNPDREFHVLHLANVASGAEGGELLLQGSAGRARPEAAPSARASTFSGA